MAFRTLHINTERTWRGGEKQTLHLVTRLLARGHVAELVCQPNSPLAERARARDVPVHEISMRGDADPVAIARIGRVMRRGKFDVCQMHTSHAHMLGVLARGFRKSPYTLVTRRVDFSVLRSWISRLKYRHGVDRYIAISHAIRRVMIEDGIDPERIEVVHSGVSELPEPGIGRDELRRQMGFTDEHAVLGNVAHFAPHKGQLFLVRAVARLRESHPQLRVAIVGEGEERAAVEAELKERGVEDLFHLAGFQKDIAAYLGAFDLFTMPSIQEGLCTSILDALLAKLPVIASNTGGIPEIIEPGVTGYLAEPGSVDDLATQIATALDDPSEAERLAAAGQRRVREQFSADGTADGTIAVYERLCGAAAGAGDEH